MSPDSKALEALLERGEVTAACELVRTWSEPLTARDGTPLMLAAIEADSPELVELLVQHGAPVDAETEEGSLLHEVIDSEGARATRLLEVLLDAGAPTDRFGVNGWTPVHLAAAWGSTEQLLALLNHGAAVDARASVDGGPTALAEAAFLGRADSVEVLLRGGANRRLRDDFGNTAERRAKEALQGAEWSPSLETALRGGLPQSAGRWLHQEFGWTGEEGRHAEVLALLRLG